MINCLTDYITLSRICFPTTPGSGVYLDEQFANIRIKSLSDTTNDEYRSPQELFEAIEKRAIRRLEDDVRAGMEGRFARTDVVSGVTSHQYAEPWNATTAGAELRGVYIEAGPSPYVDINIEQVQLYLPGTSTVPIYIYDANNGDLLDTLSISPTAAGFQTLQVNKSYSIGGKTRRLFVCYDATSITSADTELLDGYGTDCMCDCIGSSPADFVQVIGAKIATGGTVIEGNLTKQGNSYGLIVTANIECSIGAFICKHKAAFKAAYLHALLIEFLAEVMHTERVNAYTIYHDREEIRLELYGDPTNPRDPGLFNIYGGMISRALSQINPNDWTCFDCDEEVMMVTTIP